MTKATIKMPKFPKPTEEEKKKAIRLGTLAAKQGKMCIPYHDPKLMKMIEHKEIGGGVNIMKAWTIAWQKEDSKRVHKLMGWK